MTRIDADRSCSDFVRNALRENGFGEKDFGIDNLDDYAVDLVELAMKEATP